MLSIHPFKTHIRQTARFAGLALILALVFSLVFPVFAAPGDLDTSFGLSSSGVNYTDIGTLTGDMAFAVAIQNDGKIVVAGKSGADIAVTRYTSAGLMDVSFSGDGKQTISIEGVADEIHAIAIQGDDKILLAGSSNDGLKNNFVLVRLTTSGALDTLFHSTGYITATLSTGNDVAHGIDLQGDGKIVVAGAAGTEFGLARFTTSGDLDTSFGGGDGWVTTTFFNSGDAAHAVAIQDDGMIVLAGSANNGSDDDFALARYDTNGNLDTGFGGGDGKVNTNFATLSNDFAYGIDLQTDGKIVVAGLSDTTNEDFAVARYTVNGDLDTTFSADGKQVTPVTGNNDQAHEVMVQPTGKIVVAGMSFTMATSNDFTLVRYTTSGELDTTFGTGGIAITDLGPVLSGNASEHTDDLGYAAALQADNKIVLAGYSDYPLANGDNNFVVARYESPNTLPTLANVSKSGLEDTTLTFASADFSAQFTDADGDSLQRVRITSLPSSGTLRLNAVDVTLNQVIPTASLGGLTYHPALNATAALSFGWNGSDGLDYAASPALVNITLQGVNDAPSFIAGGSRSLLEDAGAQSYPGWASAISAGPADEIGQVLTFTVTTDNDALFTILPAVDSTSGDLTFTTALNANGVANCSISLKDSGGTANGGVDSSTTQNFSITVNPVNDAPTFTKGADQSVLEDSGPQVVIGWATAMSPGPTSDEAGQSLSFLVSSSNPALFSAGPSITPAGDLSFTPAANASGSALISVSLQDNGGTVNGGVDTSTVQTFTINLSAVNDAPSFVAGPDDTVNEDYGMRVVTSWATAISPGPANESSQVISFLVTAANPGLFANGPAVSPMGVLTYAPVPNLFGSSIITVTAQDNGGTANGGINISSSQTFTITVNPVNDAPSFVIGADQVVDEDAGPQNVAAWASAISAGANESSQVLTFVTQTSNDDLFAALPDIEAASGNLTYHPMPNLYGSALVTVTLQDDGGTANGGIDVSPSQTFTITVNPVNDAPQVSDINKTGFKNTSIAFSAADFTNAFVDIDGDSLAFIRIVAFPLNGRLMLNGIGVIPGQEIPVKDLGSLVFTPDDEWVGQTTITWNGSDGSILASSTALVNITILPEAPNHIYLPWIMH